MHLVETFALIRNSKIIFKNLFWLKFSILKKNTLQTFSPLIFCGNKRSHILKNNHSPLAADLFEYVWPFCPPGIKDLIKS